MGALDEISMIVKEARTSPRPLSSFKPINWFNETYQNKMNGAPKKFDFRSEALNILKPFRQRVGQHGADSLAREFGAQFNDMQANPGRYDEKAQRAMLDQWKSRIAQFDAQAAQAAKTRQLTQNRQAIVAPKMPKSLGSGWTGRQVVSGGSAPVARVQNAELNPKMNVAKTVGGKNYFDVGGGKLVAQNDLPSMKMMARWNTQFPDTTEGRKSYLASYMPRIYRLPSNRINALKQVAKK